MAKEFNLEEALAQSAAEKALSPEEKAGRDMDAKIKFQLKLFHLLNGGQMPGTDEE